MLQNYTPPFFPRPEPLLCNSLCSEYTACSLADLRGSSSCSCFSPGAASTIYGEVLASSFSEDITIGTDTTTMSILVGPPQTSYISLTLTLSHQVGFFGKKITVTYNDLPASARHLSTHLMAPLRARSAQKASHNSAPRIPLIDIS